jgi:acetyl-CoA carboxylase beta subunit
MRVCVCVRVCVRACVCVCVSVCMHLLHRCLNTFKYMFNRYMFIEATACLHTHMHALTDTQARTHALTDRDAHTHTQGRTRSVCAGDLMACKSPAHTHTWLPHTHTRVCDDKVCVCGRPSMRETWSVGACAGDLFITACKAVCTHRHARTHARTHEQRCTHTQGRTWSVCVWETSVSVSIQLYM